MKRVIIFAAAAVLLLTGCSSYAEPEISALTDALISDQGVDDFLSAEPDEISLIFDFDPQKVEECALLYAGGGSADTVAVFKLKSSSDVQEFDNMLSDYKASRYEDFKGYAPFEAEKVENGKVLCYGRYVLLVILPDISKAQSAADSAFSA